MRQMTGISISISMLVLFSLYAEETVARPPDYTIQFNLRETAGDPTSDITHMVTLGLLKDTVDGNSIGWEVAVMTIRELDQFGQVTISWSKADPFIDTPDGLWWIDHADPNAPVNGEFMVPPRVLDTLQSPNTGVAALMIDIEGGVYAPPPEGAPFPDTSSLSYLMEQPGDPPPPPKKDEKDEPIEVPPDTVEPYPA